MGYRGGVDAGTQHLIFGGRRYPDGGGRWVATRWPLGGRSVAREDSDYTIVLERFSYVVATVAT